MLKAREAGGPTGTIREPNSTPMVTSCRGENRPSHRRIVNYGLVSHGNTKVRARAIDSTGRYCLGWFFDLQHTLDFPVPESPRDTIFAI